MHTNHFKKAAKSRITIRLDLAQLVLKEGLRALIEGVPDLSFLDEELETHADVTVIDLSDNGAAEKLYGRSSESDANLIVLTDELHSTVLDELVKSSARAVVAKTMDFRSLINAVRVVASGRKWLDPLVAQASEKKTDPPIEQRARWESLTNRERQVAELMLQGSLTDSIALALGVSPHTVRNYRRNLFGKLHIHSRLELAPYWETQR